MNKKNRAFSILQGRSGAVILALAIVLLLVSLWMTVGHEAFDAWRARRIEEKTKELYYTGALPEGGSSLFPVAYADEEAPAQIVLPEIHEDFRALYEANTHTVGWVKAGERIDYPVVQLDNWYYLNRNFYGDRDSNGTVFLNQYNTLVPRSDVLLLHGHNTRSGAMFAELLKFEKYSYVAEHPLVTFRTIYDAEDVYYAPVFGFNASMEEDHPDYVDIARFSFEDDVPAEGDAAQGETVRQSSAYQAYLDELASLSIWQAPVDVNVDDELLMLVTCSYYQENGRFMLVCRKLREGETPESISALYADSIAD